MADRITGAPSQADMNKRKPQKVRITFGNANSNDSKSKGPKPAAGSVGMTEAQRRKLGY